ncbi:kinesin-like protein KIF14 isoform X2 [Pteropus medius]|uniref:kinesin-like protein KIF14 isoform X2 n=1 Tax=Pteropus vampyrus TaxID=132908 RepID=UPI00196B0D36|nr:kinesin-like protein KIF14 isoform X2 [Pteropus giganteus]
MSVHAELSTNSDPVGAPASPESSSRHVLGHSSGLQLHSKLEMSECENDDPSLRSASHVRDINLTYVISACRKAGDAHLTPNSSGRLTLQRRVTRNRESPLLGNELGASAEKRSGTRLTLQCRAGTGRVDEWGAAQRVKGAAGGDRAPGETSANVQVVDDKQSLVASSAPSAEDLKVAEMTAEEKYKETLSALSGPNDNVALKCLSHRVPVGPQSQTRLVRAGYWAARPVQSPLDGRESGTGKSHPRSIGKNAAKNSSKFESLEKRAPPRCAAERTSTPRRAPHLPSPATPVPRSGVPSPQVRHEPTRSLLANKRERSREGTAPPQEEAAAQTSSADREPLEAESSQVTVAVRVRPFSKRETVENAAQVVFMDGGAIAVRHPDTKHVYSFTYDLALWSFDAGHPGYASQAAVYEALAAPLLARAFQGYNTCLFAYGQTGSGKSYTMMGYGEEPGIIPRFCEDLFARVAKKHTQEVSCHLEMSFFEVYNEKIHDLLVCKGENGQRKQPLRVREHPASGPYVEALSANVVSSYSDIQSWLELGNKQRATAATGVNDKSSRSHSVLTLVLTQTKTEFVAGEEHDHRVTSRTNLVDLAGSERCGSAQTSGEQLKEGVSINKSLLTLGKVISALSEHVDRKRVFIPYRESVLTWLLKESLGGNSRTAMVATVSPAAGSVEETLSTLRYAQQARAIVNVARVNEDGSAALVRELKAEIEKLKAAQRSRQNIDPERYRLCQQEITSLRMKLHQRERDMAEMQRVWKEKFEQAERRKLQEIKELQKAGITFQVDNRLPNLVNLTEDPQLSEMLLYVIKEGTSTVGKCHPGSSHDIQLSGVLVAEDHCTIRNFDGTVSVVPVGDAKTYVNGRHISEPTVLHHGDRLVLGGEHYFRFNHPVEVQSGKRPAGEGPKDFEFAKNELLVAQRSQLEAEVREAQLRAREETLRGIRVAEEMARRELSSQKAAYESRIGALEAELKEESQRKKLQEISNQKANDRIEELEEAKRQLEQEVRVGRTRLHVEALAARQVLEDHSIRHARILEALEAEKRKIAAEVRSLQQSRGGRDRAFAVQTNWSSMKLSMMIQEANAISSKFKRHYVFGRHATPGDGCGSGTRVRVQDLRLGVCTSWSLEKFESKLAAMKELYESNSGARSEDIFCDPDDEWEPDITDTPLASLSRRRSRSLAKNRRISGCLRDVQAPPIQNSHSSCSWGSAGTSGALCPGAADPVLPGICRELIGSSAAALARGCGAESAADSLLGGFLRVYAGLHAVSRAHEDQDEDSPDGLFSDREAQAHTVRLACAFGQLVVLAAHWPRGVGPATGAVSLGDELGEAITKLGSHLQLFLQGCCADIPAMVADAQQNVLRTVRRAVRCVGQLAVLQGSALRFLDDGGSMDDGSGEAAGAPERFAAALWDGVGSGLRLLLDSGIDAAERLQRELRGQHAPDEVAQQMRASAMALIGSLENIFAQWKTKSCRAQAQENNSGYQDLKKMVNLAPQFLKLKHCLEQTIQIIIAALRGRRSDPQLLGDCVESLCSLARDLRDDGGARDDVSVHDDDLGGTHAPRDSCAKSCRDLESAARSLLFCLGADGGPGLLTP